MTTPDTPFNITQMMATSIENTLRADPKTLAVCEPKLIVANNVTLESMTCVYHVDITQDLWFTAGRWSKLVKEYVNRLTLEKFIHQGIEIHRGRARAGASTGILFQEQANYAGRHWWGGCLQGIVFSRDRTTSTITLNSRTTYMGYMGMLDAGIAHLVAKRIDPELNGIRFRWNIASMQLDLTKLLPYVYTHPDLGNQLRATAKRNRILKKRGKPIEDNGWNNLAQILNRFRAMHKKYGAEALDREKHAATRQIMQKWMQHEGYIEAKRKPKSFYISELDFSRAG